MPEETRRERDLILAPNEYAFILDETKGNVINYVGPHKTSLANTDQPVAFNRKSKRFERCSLEVATSMFAIAPEGWYIVLKNPAQDNKHPREGTANSLTELNVGRKVNIPGPVSFAPWPGQMVRVIKGHHLRSNQYLIVRVYDDEAARANWGKAVIKPQTIGSVDSAIEPGEPGTGTEPAPAPGPTGTTGAADPASPEKPATAVEVKSDAEIPDLTLGKLLVIKGTDVSFYIPPTGIEVVPDRNGEYVLNAVVLERLEYCILLSEDGNKRYIKGPAVVFPLPIEVFVMENGARKFKAIELNEISGLYIKVIAPYEEGSTKYRVGDELFITGKDQMIYFPRPEHAIVRYGDREVNYAVAIPAGEARYILNRLSGQITLQKGPSMFLPDPRKEVIVRRVLPPRIVDLWFPGNQEAMEYNRQLMDIMTEEKEVIADGEIRKHFAKQKKGQAQEMDMDDLQEFEELQAQEEIEGAEGVFGDQFTRKQSFTAPRTVTLDTKYEGAVSINVWTGYAVMVISKTGDRKVIAGPKTYLLEYDETLETIEFSTGTPKRDDKLVKTVYLRVLHNKVSDIVSAETKDLCEVNVTLSYRVNLEGEPEKWFDVENYVKFITDHMRSMLRHAIRGYGVEVFYADAISIIRDTILGTQGAEGKRPGRIFEENGMRIYDVEVLDVTIGDDIIEDLLIDAQHNTVGKTLEIAAEKRNLEFTLEKENIKQKVAEAEAVTLQTTLTLDIEEVQKRLELNLAGIKSEIEAEKKKLTAKWTEQELLEKISGSELLRQKARSDFELSVSQQQIVQRIEELKAEVEAVVNKAQAISPQLIAALQAFSDRSLAESMAESMAPLAILGGKSVADVFSQLLKGTVLEKVISTTAGQVEKVVDKK
ncbi:MAG: hypothetical protein GY754_28630 [bacterium]|nr:hypothetical protein [bacterium]